MNAKEIIGALSDGYWRVSVIDEIDSTQNYLRTSSPKPGDLITAEYQTAGRGRLDRKFIAKKSSALLFSLYLEPKIENEKLGYLSLLVGASVAKTLNEITGSKIFECKWPNDIVCNGYKIAGMLAEKTNSGVIVGVGINISSSKEELPVSHASSVLLETGEEVNRNTLLAKVLNDLGRELADWESGKDLTSHYRELSATLGREVQVEIPGGESLAAVALDIDSTGALHLDNGRVITVGDVIHLESKLSE